MLDPALPEVTAVSDPAGDFSFSAPSQLTQHFQQVYASVSATPSSSAAHDLDLTLVGGSHLTCTGCLTVRTALPAPTGSASSGNGSISLALTAPTADPGETATGYRVLLSDGTSTDTASNAPTLSGLVNGTNYTVLVSALTDQRAGQLLWLSGRPGTAPATPSVTLTPGLHKVTAAASTTSDGYPVVYSWTVKVGSAAPYTIEGSNSIVVPTSGRQTVAVSAGATSDMGTSSMSAPVSATSFTYPSPPRLVRTSYADGKLAVAWNPPADSGGRPLSGYELWLTIGGSTTHRLLRATSYATAAPAGAAVSVKVRAVNDLAPGDSGVTESTADVGEVVALDSAGHVRHRYLKSGSWTSLGGPAMVGTPSLARSSTGLRMVVAGDSAGRVWGWTRASGWHVMSATRCTRPAAAFPHFGQTLYLACVGSDGKLRAATEDITGTAVPTGVRFASFSAKPVGRLAAVRGTFVFRVAAFDTAGHNVVAVEPFGEGATRLPLKCLGDPGAGTGGLGTYDSTEGWVSCLATTTKIVWLRAELANFHTTHRTVGSAALPFSGRGQVSVFASRRGSRALISVVGSDGVVRELDTTFRTWRSAGGLVVKPGISTLIYRG